MRWAHPWSEADLVADHSGTIRQPAGPTDGNGMTTAVISSTQAGLATVTAFNVTDGQPLAALAGVNSGKDW